MAVINSKKITQKTLANKSSMSQVTNKRPSTEVVIKESYFSRFKVSLEITESCEFYAEVKELHETEDKTFLRLAPYKNISGQKCFYEEVYIYLGRVNSPTSAAGQFLVLFEGARHWGDVKDRIVGVEIKLNTSKEGKVFKNVVRVFETDEDELIFDDDHMRYPPAVKRVMERVNALDVEEVEELEEDDEDDISVIPSKSKFTDEIFDDDDIDEEDFEEE